MRHQRTLVAIPPQVAAGIDRIAGHRNRTEFIVEVLEQEILRREQLAALEQAAGKWKDEDHPELAEGGAAYVTRIRQEDEERFDRLVASRDLD
jgi:hypothetical protein